MFFVFLSCVCFNTKLEQQKKSMENEFQELITNISKRKDEIKTEISSTLQKLAEEADDIKSTSNKIKYIHDKIKNIDEKHFFPDVESQIKLTKYFKPNSINISLMSISAGIRSKGIVNKITHALFPSSVISPISPNKSHFWTVNSKSATFTFLADLKSKATKFEINQTKANRCGIRKFRLIFQIDHKAQATSIYEIDQHQNSPSTFDLDQSYWFRTFDLEILSNFGDDCICLPSVRVFDNDIYSN